MRIVGHTSITVLILASCYHASLGFHIPSVSHRSLATNLSVVVSEGKFMYMTEEEDRLLKEKGDLEEQLMQTPTPIKPLKLRTRRRSSASSGTSTHNGMGRNGGFGSSTPAAAGKTKGGKKQKQSTPTKSKSPHTTSGQDPSVVQSIVKTIQEDGMVRIDNVLSPTAADNLRNYLIDLRARSTAAIEGGHISDSQERFADVLLNQNRCDLKIPLGPAPVHEALFDILVDGGDPKSTDDSVNDSFPSIVRSVIEGVYNSYHGQGKYASLWELNCFMSNAGARRQLVHADNVCLEPVRGLEEGEPIILTCFVALQDIDASMGPTVFMPKTHTIDAHNRFFETGRDEASSKTDAYSPKNEILKSSKAIMGAPLPKGSCIIFDPRVLHCAGANVCDDTEKTRALFYLSFKNPKVDHPGCPSTSGYGIATAEVTMDQLATDLLHERKGEPVRHIALLASSP